MPSSPSSLFSSTAWLRPGWYWMLSSLASKLQISLAAAARAAVNFAVANFDRIDVRRVLEELEGAPPPPSYKPQLGRLREVRLYMYDYAVKRLKKLLREALGLDKVSHGYVVAFSAVAYMMYARREALGPVLADMLRQVYAAVRGEASWERKRRALSELYRRLETVRALSKREGRDYVSMWLAVIKEVEEARDPLAVLAKYLGGDVPRIVAIDHYRQLWAKLLEDSGGDPQRFKQLFWLRRDGIKAAARTKAQREAVEAVAGLVDTRPDMAVEYAKAIVDGRYVKLEREVDRGEVRRRAEEWLEAFRNIFAKTYLEARERGVWLGSAALGKGDVLKRFYRWYKRYGRYLDGELARRLAPVVKLAELHDMYLRLLGEGAPWRGEAEALVNVGKEASNALMEFLIQEGIFHRHEQRP
ncbi:hypothetical protein [Pyrobaculum sp.]|uniref:hypothetical protein n=1 Tax=Pyrobaculum sp. TaxID=2004705 RepID=UPI00316B11D3